MWARFGLFALFTRKEKAAEPENHPVLTAEQKLAKYEEGRRICNQYMLAANLTEKHFTKNVSFYARKIHEAIIAFAQALPSQEATENLEELLNGSSIYYSKINYNYLPIILNMLESGKIDSLLSLLPDPLKMVFLKCCFDQKHVLGHYFLQRDEKTIKKMMALFERHLPQNFIEQLEQYVQQDAEIIRKYNDELQKRHSEFCRVEHLRLHPDPILGRRIEQQKNLDDRVIALRTCDARIGLEFLNSKWLSAPVYKKLRELAPNSPRLTEAAEEYCGNGKLFLNGMRRYIAFEEKHVEFYLNVIRSFIRALKINPNCEEAATNLAMLLDGTHDSYNGYEYGALKLKSDEVYSTLIRKCSKELLAQAILLLPNDKKSPLLYRCLGQKSDSSLRDHFWKSREFFSCSITSGTLKQLNTERKRLRFCAPR